jgi:hypothetical protein
MPFATFSPSVQFGRFSTLAYPTVVPVTKVLTTAGGVVTLTVPDLLGGLIRVDCQDAQTLTTPTAAAICAGIQGCQIGCSFETDVINYGDSLLTVALGAGVTKPTIAGVSSILTLATLTGKRFKFVVTNNTVGSEAIETYATAGAVSLA